MGIFAKLKASLQGRDDADRYLKGTVCAVWRTGFAASMMSF